MLSLVVLVLYIKYCVKYFNMKYFVQFQNFIIYFIYSIYKLSFALNTCHHYRTTLDLICILHHAMPVFQNPPQPTYLSSFLGRLKSEKSMDGPVSSTFMQSDCKTEPSSSISQSEVRSSRFKIKKRIIVGNVSK